MTTLKFATSIVAALGLLAAYASSSHAGHVLYHGSLCTPDVQSFDLVDYSQFGVHNTSSNIFAAVNCGGAIDTSGTLQIVELVVSYASPPAR